MDDTNMIYSIPISGIIPIPFIADHQPGFPIVFESGFEPQTRTRSNTWPLPRPEGYLEKNVLDRNEAIEVGTPPQQGPLDLFEGQLPTKKSSSRRNAWGNLSYADLISQAISSSPENRLTLSQIYNWMIENVPYFKDKGDSKSSAGWKNSIRHNLSLHGIFMRVQNEGTGKSSWWTMNPDAKPGKSSRRRAASMETGKLEKLRGRVKKKLEALRNGASQADLMTPSPCSSVGEGLDVFPDSPFHPASGFRLSPDFRSRASSNASSSVGRLSPIPAVEGEADWTPSFLQGSSHNPEQLAGALEESMRLESYRMYGTSPSNHQQQQSVPSPSYLEAQYPTRHWMHSVNLSHDVTPTPQYFSQQSCPIHRLQSCACEMHLSEASGMSTSYQQNEPNSSLIDEFYQQQQQQEEQTLEYLIEEFVCQQQQQQHQHQQPQQPQSGPAGLSPPLTPISFTHISSTLMGQPMGVLDNSNSSLYDDLDISIERLHGGLDCNDDDDDEVIENVLSMEDTYASGRDFPTIRTCQEHR